MTTNLTRDEYPRPQFERSDWQNLNGIWNFDYDDKNNGEKEKWYKNDNFDKEIKVPFSFESKASGINNKKSHNYIWYQRYFEISKKHKNKKILIYFSGSDYITKVWINNKFVGIHKGGYTSFSFDITDFIKFNKSNNIVVKIKDTLSKNQPRGKQSWKENNFKCWYSRTTGIWKTVWLEFLDKKQYLENVKITPDIDNKKINLEYKFFQSDFENEYIMYTTIEYKNEIIKNFKFKIKNKIHKKNINIENSNKKIKLWSPKKPRLYDIYFEIKRENKVVDKVKSYFGMRKISIENNKIMLNNKPFYQKLILDQGYWPETLTTPPGDKALKKDLTLVKKMGFNGVRKHQKIEDNRFYYWADKLGLVVWAEMGSTYNFNNISIKNFLNEWFEVVNQLYNHPSIIAWVPFNESWGIDEIKSCNKQQSFSEAIYNLTKSIDNQRFVITNDGWEHTISDIITLHDYDDKPKKIKKRYQQKDIIINNEIKFNKERYIFADGYDYKDQPIIMSEFGGIAFNKKNGWGYGKKAENGKELLQRLEETITVINDIDYFQGYCYTQLTDVEQEKNGLMTENRILKVPIDKIRKIIE